MYEDIGEDDMNKYDSQAADSETLLSDSETQRPTRSRRWNPSCALLSLLVSILSLLAAAGGVWIGARWVRDIDELCISHISQYGPVLEDVDVSFDTVQFNGSLLKENVYRQDAGPKVDAAWEALGVNYRALKVPAELADKSNLKPDQVKINTKYGGGFPGNVEGLHHLHCLNLLRQSLYYNYDYYHARGEGAFQNDDVIVRYHVSHCLDILRQQLMCTVDIGILGQVWIYPDSPEAYVDFNTKHKCRNFDQIRQWAEERQLPVEIPPDFLQPLEKGDTIYEIIP